MMQHNIKPLLVYIYLDELTIDPRFQLRVGCNCDDGPWNEQLAREYAEKLEDGEDLKAIKVVGPRYLLADGFHRTGGHTYRPLTADESEGGGRKQVRALWYECSADDADEVALLEALKANADNGARRDLRTQRNAILTATDKWPDAEPGVIGKICGCSSKTVKRAWKAARIQTPHDRRKAEAEALVKASPDLSNVAIAERVGVSRETVRRMRSNAAQNGQVSNMCTSAPPADPHPVELFDDAATPSVAGATSGVAAPRSPRPQAVPVAPPAPEQAPAAAPVAVTPSVTSGVDVEHLIVEAGQILARAENVIRSSSLSVPEEVTAAWRKALAAIEQLAEGRDGDEVVAELKGQWGDYRGVDLDQDLKQNPLPPSGEPKRTPRPETQRLRKWKAEVTEALAYGLSALGLDPEEKGLRQANRQAKLNAAARLDTDFTVEELKLAIDGAASDEFLQRRPGMRHPFFVWKLDQIPKYIIAGAALAKAKASGEVPTPASHLPVGPSGYMARSAPGPINLSPEIKYPPEVYDDPQVQAVREWAKNRYGELWNDPNRSLSSREHAALASAHRRLMEKREGGRV